MELAAQTIPCSSHPKEAINRISTNLDATKLLYCFECVLESEDRKALSSTLVNIQSFIDIASQFYSDRRGQIRTTTSGPPAQYLDLLSSRAETLDTLTKHISQEKEKIEILFDDILNRVVNIVNKARHEHLSRLDEQLRIACHHFSFFERQLRRSFPRDEDLDDLAPSREQLEARLSALSNATQFHAFAEEIKDDMYQSKIEREQRTEGRNYWDNLSQNLKKTGSVRPEYKVEEDMSQLKKKIQTVIDDSLKEFVIFEGALCHNLLYSYPSSDIVLPQHFEMIRKWLPDKFAFKPQLLYKGTKDGLHDYAKYHQLCDKKGPTITIIRCKFNGSSKTSLIGGFLDIDLSKDGGYMASKEAFIFSLTRNVKCPIMEAHTKYATYGQEICGPVFGTQSGNDILIHNNTGTCKPSCYEDSGRIIEVEGHSKTNSASFTYDEIEVYKLN